MYLTYIYSLLYNQGYIPAKVISKWNIGGKYMFMQFEEAISSLGNLKAVLDEIRGSL
jgi:hypothetical protein